MRYQADRPSLKFLVALLNVSEADYDASKRNHSL